MDYKKPNSSKSQVDPEKTQQDGFDIPFLKRAWLLFMDCLVDSWTMWFIVLSLGIAAVLYSYISMQIGRYAGDFFTVVTKAITSKEEIGMVILIISGLYVALAFVFATTKAMTSFLGIYVRTNVTDRMNMLYFRNNNFYKVSLCKDFSNPDQQLTQDIERYSASYAAVSSQLISSPIFIVFFGVKVGLNIHWSAPFIVFGYYLLTFFIQRFVMSPIVNYISEQERLEGCYRFVSQKVAQYAESIGLYGAAHTEHEIAFEAFKKLIGNNKTIVKWEWLTWCLSYSISYLATVVGYLIVGMPLLLHDQSPGLLSDYVATSLYDLGMLAWGFTQITVLSSQLAEFAGYTNRIGKLYQYLMIIDDHRLSGIQCSSSTMQLSFDADSILDPLGNILVQDVHLEFNDNILVMGPSGSGKSTILRALAGLSHFKKKKKSQHLQENHFSLNINSSLPSSSSTSSPSPSSSSSSLLPSPNIMRSIRSESLPFISIDDIQSVLFVPQVTYLPLGDIYQQIVYPKHKNDCNDITKEKVIQLLKEIGLEILLQKSNLFSEDCWDFLSPGQKQKLSMIRVLYHRPKLVILDEITSHLDLNSEYQFYRLCEMYHITVFSVGHRESLIPFHGRVYHIHNQLLLPLVHTSTSCSSTSFNVIGSKNATTTSGIGSCTNTPSSSTTGDGGSSLDYGTLGSGTTF